MYKVNIRQAGFALLGASSGISIKPQRDESHRFPQKQVGKAVQKTELRRAISHLLLKCAVRRSLTSVDWSDL